MTRYFLRPTVWDNFAQECAKRIPHDNPSGHVEDLAQSIERGECELLQISKGGAPAGLVVCAVEGIELNIVAAFAENSGHDITAALLPEMENFARSRGCKSVRFHTVRPGLVAKASSQGFRVSEVILRKNVE